MYLISSAWLCLRRIGSFYHYCFIGRATGPTVGLGEGFGEPKVCEKNPGAVQENVRGFDVSVSYARLLVNV